MLKSTLKRVLVGAMLVSFVFATACGSTPEGTAAPASTGGSTATSTAASGGGSGETITMPLSGVEVDASIFADPIDINYLGYRYDLIDSLIGSLNTMEEIPGVSVEEIYDYNMENMFSLASSAGGDNPYSIVNLTAQSTHLFSGEDYLLPLNDYVEKYWDDYNFGDIPQEYWDWVTIDGNIYGIPFTTNVQVFFYRKDVFEEYDIEVPTTWDEMIEASNELVEKGWDKSTYIAAYALPGGVTGEFQNFLSAMGGDWYDAETNYPAFNDEIGMQALEKIQQVFDVMPEATLTYTTDDVTLLMQTGEAAMTQLWATRMPSFQDPAVSSVVDMIGVTPPLALEPGGPPTNQLNWDSFAIPQNVAGNPEAVFLAMAEMTSEAAQMESAEYGIPMRGAVVEADPTLYERHPEFVALEESVEQGARIYPYHQFPYFQLGADIVASYVNDAVVGNVSYQDAMDRAEQDIITLLIDRGYITEE